MVGITTHRKNSGSNFLKILEDDFKTCTYLIIYSYQLKLVKINYKSLIALIEYTDWLIIFKNFENSVEGALDT